MPGNGNTKQEAVAELRRRFEQFKAKENKLPRPGVFAAGDCRSGSPKRVAFAIGDGATAITPVHKFLDNTVPERSGGEVAP
jgi:thioredoxin reductase